MNGHDWEAIYSTIQKAVAATGPPGHDHARTHQGKGNRETEGLVDCHQRQDPGRDHLPAPHVRAGVQVRPSLLNSGPSRA